MNGVSQTSLVVPDWSLFFYLWPSQQVGLLFVEQGFLITDCPSPCLFSANRARHGQITLENLFPQVAVLLGEFGQVRSDYIAPVLFGFDNRVTTGIQGYISMPEKHRKASGFSLHANSCHRSSISPLRFLVHFGPAFSRACLCCSEWVRGFG
ncbi:uncharacterized protein BO87DRAFT_205722 [Aspergillus neoniger CBS 115656]|uniref:Uncharacterized protein n=1 Tax=Aspergillus neoniger (strain CBS 115656) TaxID=1448310 RepID=A0A318YSP9_ASPNB|nr:hypothetical protein BO87DRAFT_205722 [Aspergillus neoniger CBS 115656]PYH37354.1 hypothetical protein BO87DRAFT_205722 [Aspergillus neoniger CBS 115656]